MPQPQRRDKLTVSLGVTDPQARKAGLNEIAMRLGMPGRKGNGSISQLLTWMEGNSEAVIAALTPIAEEHPFWPIPGFDD